LRGEEITFKAGEALYTGKVDGKRISGTFTDKSTKSDFVATKTGN
jgi:hypothetical protein